MYTNEAVFSTTSHALLCNQKQYLCFMCCPVVFYTQNHLAQVLSPRFKLTFAWGRGARGGGGGKQACSAGHTRATDIAGHDGCCQRCCLATQYPSRKFSSLAGSMKQTGLVRHGTGHGKIIVVLFQLCIILLSDFLYRSTYLRGRGARRGTGAGKTPGFFKLPPNRLQTLVEFYWLVP